MSTFSLDVAGRGRAPYPDSANANSLIVTAGEHAEDAQQIWRVSLSDGQVSRVTNDLSDYVQVSSSRDTKVLAAVQIINRRIFGCRRRQTPA